MSFLSYFRAAAVAAALALSATPAMAQSLSTTYAGGNSQDGNLFDLTPSTTLTINSFDINAEGAGQTLGVEVYWRSGTVEGFQDTATGWTLMGTAQVVSQGEGTATHVPIGGLNMQAGTTYGIYLRVVENGSFNVAYTDGGPTVFANADLTLKTFYGKANGDSFMSGTTFSPRQWNGTVYYTKTQTCASEGYTSTKLEWCKNICERGLTGATLDIWIHRWITRYRQLPYCAVENVQG